MRVPVDDPAFDEVFETCARLGLPVLIHTGEPAPFKSGLYSLAQAFPEVQLIPAWIDNVQRVMPKGEVVPVPILCAVVFGAPIALAPGEERRAFLDRARAAVMALRGVV